MRVVLSGRSDGPYSALVDLPNRRQRRAKRPHAAQGGTIAPVTFASRDTCQTMPEEATTPDLVELMRETIEVSKRHDLDARRSEPSKRRSLIALHDKS